MADRHDSTTAPSRRQFFGSAVGAGVAAAQPPIFIVAGASSLATACDLTLARLAWMDRPENSDAISEEERDAQMDQWGGVFRRAIIEPSTGPGDLAAKARLMLADLDRFKPLDCYGSDDYRLMRTILSECIGLVG